jgi:hypothetical protein
LFIEPNEIVCQIDEKICGYFPEHIYHSVNGGLWGERVWNHSFEDVEVVGESISEGEG